MTDGPDQVPRRSESMSEHRWLGYNPYKSPGLFASRYVLDPLCDIQEVFYLG